MRSKLIYIGRNGNERKEVKTHEIRRLRIALDRSVLDRNALFHPFLSERSSNSVSALSARLRLATISRSINAIMATVLAAFPPFRGGDVFVVGFSPPLSLLALPKYQCAIISYPKYAISVIYIISFRITLINLL